VLTIETPRRRWLSLTPLIDVVFILLMFFMLSTQFYRTSVLNLTLADTNTENAIVSPSDRAESTATIVVLGEQRWRELNPSSSSIGTSFTVSDTANLARFVSGKRVQVQAAATASLQDVITVLDQLAGLGIIDAQWIQPDSKNSDTNDRSAN